MTNKRLLILFLCFILIGCSPRQDYKKQLQQVTQKWDDALGVASNTGRIALSQPVSRLQEIKREADAIQVPDRMKDCYGHLLSHMDFTTESFLIFMQNAEDDASSAIEKADDEFEIWQLCSLSGKEAAKLLKERLDGAGKFSNSVCFGLGYGFGSFNSRYPQRSVSMFEMYRGLFVKDGEFMDPLEEILERKLRNAKKEYMIPLIKRKMKRRCFPEWINGYSFGSEGRSIDESSVPYKDLAGAFADTVMKVFVSTYKVPTTIKEQLKQEQQKLSNDPLFVSGILGGDDPIAIIGGKTLKRGEMVDSYIINAIGNGYVEFLGRDGNVVRKELGK